MVVTRRRVHKHYLIQRFIKKSSKRVQLAARFVTTYNTPSTTGRVLETIVGLLVVIVPFSVQAGVFPFFGGTDVTGTTTTPEVITMTTVLDTPLLVAANNPDPSSSRGDADVLAQDGALVSSGPIGKDEISAKKQSSGEISVYTVREGDSLSMIAEMFDVTANTILWANDLSSAKAIKPGDTLIILPIAGVRHIVKSGDTLASIAKKYEANAEEVASYNQLAKDAPLTIGETVIVPGGALHTTVVAKKTNGTSKATATAKGTGSFVHPAPGTIKTQGIHGYNGVDFGGSVGTPVRAALGGEVIVSKSSGWNGGYGQYVVIKHNNGTQTLYAHLSSNSVGVGDTVVAGETIGGLGNTGKSTGPHLHFEVRGGRNPF
ncbi:MAG: hypothetical protein RLZZ360_696 [Candidatus Parcubacteria bacterium]|jgi:LysM repeat protein